MKIHNRPVINHDPDNYQWMACRLTRHMMAQGRSVPMKESLTRLANWHMKGGNDCRTGYELSPGIEMIIERRCDPPPGYSNIGSFLAKFDKSQVRTEESNQPPEEVQFTSRIEGPREDPIEAPAWFFNANMLHVKDIPESVAQNIINGMMEPYTIIDHPFLKHRKIDCVEWRSKQWRKGRIIKDRLVPTMMVKGIKVYFKGGHEFQPIKVSKW